MVNEKIRQAVQILKEMDVDLWLTFVRETGTVPDPALELIFGSHVTWNSAFMITSTGKTIAIVGSLDAQNVKDHASYDVITYVDSIREDFLSTLKEIDPQTIAINTSVNDVTADGLTHGMYQNLLDLLKDTPYGERLISSEKIIAALRGRKSEAEVAAIQGAIDATLAIYDEVTGWIRPGVTELQVQDYINERMNSRGLTAAWDPAHCPAVFTGPDSAGAHAMPTGRPVEPGHIMNVDFGVRYNGYVSDLQRTWYFLRDGETRAPEPVQKGFDIIRDAITAAAEAIKPGMMGWEVDIVARNYITERGYDEYPHGLGHQVGRKAHDGACMLGPRWERYKDIPYMKVEAGQVYTIEPRLTVDGYGVATIEEIGIVTQEGFKFLSERQMELILIK